MQMLSGYYQDYRKVIAWNHASRILKNPSMGFSEKKIFSPGIVLSQVAMRSLTRSAIRSLIQNNKDSINHFWHNYNVPPDCVLLGSPLSWRSGPNSLFILQTDQMALGEKPD